MCWHKPELLRTYLFLPDYDALLTHIQKYSTHFLQCDRDSWHPAINCNVPAKNKSKELLYSTVPPKTTRAKIDASQRAVPPELRSLFPRFAPHFWHFDWKEQCASFKSFEFLCEFERVRLCVWRALWCCPPTVRWFSRPIQPSITEEELLPIESMRSAVHTYGMSL